MYSQSKRSPPNRKPESIETISPGQTALQRKAANAPGVAQLTDIADKAAGFVQHKPNRTGMPDSLKNGTENLSGLSMDDVRVHYNSPKPAQLQAHAYAQGSQIHLGPGQEKHLPHEAWHVVQQKQGRVQPTMQMKGVNINDNAGLEREADVMGDKVMVNPVDSKLDTYYVSDRGLNVVETTHLRLNKTTPTHLKKTNLGEGVPAQRKVIVEGTIHDSVKTLKQAMEDKGIQWNESWSKILLGWISNQSTHEFINFQELKDILTSSLPVQSQLDSLTRIEIIHEDIMSNLVQGMTDKSKKQLNEKHGNSKKILEALVMDKKTMEDRLYETRNSILQGEYLVRIMSSSEASAFYLVKTALERNLVFQKGKEGMKAFAIDHTYSFKDQFRNNGTSEYEKTLYIHLTPQLKQFFIDYLTANQDSLAEIKTKSNPQFKYERGQNTILIPPSGWSAFMSIVGSNYRLA